MLKLLVRLMTKLLKMEHSEDEHRADMYLPDWLMAFGLVLLALGITGCVAGIITRAFVWPLLGVAALLLGAAALACWRNQKIQILPNDSFAYTTFLGNAYQYRFSEIQGLRQNNDSMTLIVAGKKVHIESIALISPRLAQRINEQLEKL